MWFKRKKQPPIRSLIGEGTVVQGELRFDQGLRELAEGLFAGASVDETGAVSAPPLTDARALRVYSGRYWEIAELRDGRLHALERSRSLWDSELPGPAADRLTLGATVKYDTRGPLKEPLRAVALVRTCRPTITFSSAVMSGKSRMFWKVRAMPASATLCTWLGEYGRPDSSKLPESGAYRPVITLKNVVLPAPFGPISP